MIILFITILSFVLYNATVIYLTGIPTSFSATYYSLENKYKCGWIFSVLLSIISIVLMILLLNITQGQWYQFLSFFATVGTLFVAFSPKFKSLEHNKIHIAFAAISVLSSLCLMVFTGFIYLAIYNILLFSYLCYKKNKYKVYFIEMSIFISVFLIILLKTL